MGNVRTFKEAFAWHIEKHRPRIADLCRATGVSRDVINKLRLEGPRTTSVENGLAIASYFGKSLDEFVRCADPPKPSSPLEVIDGVWIGSRLKGYRGEKTELARSLGVDHTVIAKILSGKRTVRATEIPKVVKFFSMNSDHAELSNKEAELVSIFRSLPSDRQDGWLDMAKVFSRNKDDFEL